MAPMEQMQMSVTRHLILAGAGGVAVAGVHRVVGLLFLPLVILYLAGVICVVIHHTLQIPVQIVVRDGDGDDLLNVEE